MSNKMQNDALTCACLLSFYRCSEPLYFTEFIFTEFLLIKLQKDVFAEIDVFKVISY